MYTEYDAIQAYANERANLMTELTNDSKKLMLNSILTGLGTTMALAGTSWLIYKWYTTQKSYMKTDWYLD